MADASPITEIDHRYSDDGVAATAWANARRVLEHAQLYWITTVRPDGRPHMTPLLGVWRDEAMHVCTGPDERKARNLGSNARCILSTGCNALEGLDVVIEGEAVRVEDEATLLALAEAWEGKYGSDWHFDVRDGAFLAGEGRALVLRVVPVTAFGFAKAPYGQTRWRFGT